MRDDGRGTMTEQQPPRDVQRFGCSTCGHFIGFIITENGKTTFPQWTAEDAGDRFCCQSRVKLLEDLKAEEAERQRPRKMGRPRKETVAA